MPIMFVLQREAAMKVMLYATDNRNLLERTEPPKAWRSPESYIDVLFDSPWYSGVHRLLSQVSLTSHRFFTERGGIGTLVSPTTGSISSPMGLGSDSLPVEVCIGDHHTYLADSMQFYLELALRLNGCPAFYVMPSFRGEVQDDRHLNQFFHAEVEIPGTLSDIMNLAELYTLRLASDLLETCSRDLEEMAGDLSHVEAFVTRGRFPVVDFKDAIALLGSEKDCFRQSETGALIITAAGERRIMKEFGDFIWLRKMPSSTVPFYQADDPLDDNWSLSADLLAGIGEVLGCGERATTAEEVRKNLSRAGTDEAAYAWYLRMKERKPMQTAGFGLGIERFLMWATRTPDIRDWALIPRDHLARGPA